MNLRNDPMPSFCRSRQEVARDIKELTKCGFVGIRFIMSSIATSRISIDVTPGQHKRLKAMAALSGKSLKDYVLERTLLQSDEDFALRELESLLAPRIESARSGRLLDDSVESIFSEVANEARS
jgi:hypothetical protein